MVSRSFPRNLFLIANLWLLLIPGCSGRVDIGGGGADSGLSLRSVSFAPSSVMAGATQSFTVSFGFNAPGGNLNGGRFNWIYEGAPNSTILPEALAGLTSGSTSLILPSIPLSFTPGTVFITTWIQDRAGNTSNRVTIAVTQRI